MRVLVTRPLHRAKETAAKLQALGHDAETWPLMETAPCPWALPTGDFDALALTSAEAPRLAGAGLAGFADLPAYCVGGRTAEAARAAGLRDVNLTDARTAEALFPVLAQKGLHRILHLTGRDVTPVAQQGLTIERRVVYTAELLDWPVTRRDALDRFDWVLLYSARAAAQFSKLCPESIRMSLKIAGLSHKVIAAAGVGWNESLSADVPDEQSLFAAAGLLCQKQG